MVLFVLLSLVYFVSSAAYFLYLMKRKGSFLLFGKRLLLCAFLLQTIQLIGHTIALGRMPVISLVEGFAFVGWAVVGLYFLLLFKYRIEVLGVLVAFLGFILWSLSGFLKHAIAPQDKVVLDIWLYLHSVLIFVSYAVFAIAFISGILYLIEEKALKKHNPRMPFAVLPSLEDFDRINYRMILLGFPLLTIGIVAGAVWAKQARGDFFLRDPKVIWSMLTWAVYAVSFHLKLTKGFCGRKLALLCVAGFAFVIVTFIGAGLAFRSFHLF